MDPSNTKQNQWQWNLRTPGHVRDAVACALWALELDGPFEDERGQAPNQLAAALGGRDGPYRAKPNQPLLYAILKSLDSGTYAGSIERDSAQTQTFRIANLVPLDGMPPNPYHVKRGRPPKAKTPARATSGALVPVSVTELAAPARNGNGHPTGPLTAAEALEAVRSIVSGTLGPSPADPLVVALEAEVSQLRQLLDTQAVALLEKYKEIEVLRRALAQHQGVRV